jgi:streptomycin 6-kinase
MRAFRPPRRVTPVNGISALRCYDGDGAARLYDSDRATGTLLLERLEPGTPLRDHPNREQAVDVACTLLHRLRRPVPSGHPFPLVRDLVGRWTDQLKPAEAQQAEAMGGPERDEFESALRALAVAEDADVLVNRDANMGNVLAAQREPWLLIDPKPMVGEPASTAAGCWSTCCGRPRAALRPGGWPGTLAVGWACPLTECGPGQPGALGQAIGRAVAADRVLGADRCEYGPHDASGPSAT